MVGRPGNEAGTPAVRSCTNHLTQSTRSLCMLQCLIVAGRPRPGNRAGFQPLLENLTLTKTSLPAIA